MVIKGKTLNNSDNEQIYKQLPNDKSIELEQMNSYEVIQESHGLYVK